MRYPEFLKKGGKIGFIAPSFGVAYEPYYSRFQEALSTFRAMGYETVLGPNCYASDGIGKSSSAENCGAEINEFFLRENCDVILSCSGGETMCEDLPYVDFGKIAEASPKWYLGYSDNTNLTFTLPVLTDTAAIYGPCAPAFGRKPWDESLKDAVRILTGESLFVKNYPKWEREAEENAAPTAPYHVTEENTTHLLSGGQAVFSGRLIGGCLDCLATLCGTRFDQTAGFLQKYRNDGIIWFLETCDLDPMGVLRALWQLKNAGWFSGALRGVIFGRPMKYGAECFGLTYETALHSIFDSYGIPVAVDADLGHLPPMMPLISGAVAEVKAGEKKLEIQMKLI